MRLISKSLILTHISLDEGVSFNFSLQTLLTPIAFAAKYFIGLGKGWSESLPRMDGAVMLRSWLRSTSFVQLRCWFRQQILRSGVNSEVTRLNTQTGVGAVNDSHRILETYLNFHYRKSRSSKGNENLSLPNKTESSYGWVENQKARHWDSAIQSVCQSHRRYGIDGENL